MNKVKCTLKVSYNDDILYYGGGSWYYYNGVFLIPMKKYTVNGSVAYRPFRGRKFFYHSKMKKNVSKCDVTFEDDLPF